MKGERDHRVTVRDAHEFGFDPPNRLVTLATMLRAIPTAVPVVGIGALHFYRRHRREQTAPEAEAAGRRSRRSSTR